MGGLCSDFLAGPQVPLESQDWAVTWGSAHSFAQVSNVTLRGPRAPVLLEPPGHCSFAQQEKGSCPARFPVTPITSEGPGQGLVVQTGPSIPALCLPALPGKRGAGRN